MMKKILLYVAMILIAFITVGPFIYTLLLALKSPGQGVYEGILPTDPTITNFIDAFNKTNFVVFLVNTFIVTGIAVVFNVIFSSLSGYALSRMEFRGRGIVLTLIIATMTVPFQLYMAPLFQMAGNLGLRNTHIGLTVLQISTAFGIYLMRQAFLSIPKDLEESAYLDGANKFQVWYKVAMPLVKPSLITLAIYTFTFTWGDYLWPLINTTDSKMYTLSIGLAQMSQNFDGGNLKLISAASILTTVPSLLVFIWLQKFFISGATDGAVKG